MEFFGFVIAVLTGVLGFLAYRNGKWMKQAHEDSLALLREINNTVRKMDDTMKKMDEKAEERHKEVLEILKKMDDTLKEIAHLIHAEGEKTRKLIKEKP